MKQISIGNHVFDIKDYHCCSLDDGEYYPKEDGKLWLYVNITDVCNGYCPFCINPGKKQGKSPINLSRFSEVLDEVKDKIYGISITGGEPFLDINLLDSLMDVVIEVMGHSVEIDTVTNGVNFKDIPKLRHIDDFDSIHLSRHCVDDAGNSKLFGFNTTNIQTIKETLEQLKDPGKIVFNCSLQKGCVDSTEKVIDYLEMAAFIGVKNTSFIGLSKCNEYCKEHFVDPGDIDFQISDRFHIWNQFQDYGYCKCSSGNYDAKDKSVRFYYRCLGNGKAPYARQLVYTADNRLLAGFGGEEILL